MLRYGHLNLLHDGGSKGVKKGNISETCFGVYLTYVLHTKNRRQTYYTIYFTVCFNPSLTISRDLNDTPSKSNDHKLKMPHFNNYKGSVFSEYKYIIFSSVYIRYIVLISSSYSYQFLHSWPILNS